MHTDELQLRLWSEAASLRLGHSVPYAAVAPDSQGVISHHVVTITLCYIICNDPST